MDESESLLNDPARLLMAELAKTAFKQGHFQLAYLLDISAGQVCRQMRREAEELSIFLAQMMREAEPRLIAA